MIFFSQNEIPNILTYQKTNIRFFKFCGSQFLASMDCPSKENPYIEELKLILFDLLLNTRKFKLHIFDDLRRFVYKYTMHLLISNISRLRH